MTTTTATTFTILHVEGLELDQLADIATHGCAAGVNGFIYSSELAMTYNQFENEIWDYLDEQAAQLGEKNGFRMVIDIIEAKQDTWTMQEVKEKAVWIYVEQKAYDLCIEHEHPDFV